MVSSRWSTLTLGWVYGLGLRSPVPHIGILAQFLGLGSQMVSLWFQLPASWRRVPAFKTRGKFLMAYHGLGVCISAMYFLIWITMLAVPIDYQPIMAVLLPVCREGLAKILTFLGRFG